MKIELFKYAIVRPFAFLGLEHSFWNVHGGTVLRTWLAMGILFTIVAICRWYMRRPINPISLMCEQAIEFFFDLCVESFGYFRYDYFSFIATLFFFTFFCNMIGILPFIEEPTSDLHTTFALGLSSFCYVQAQKIKMQGVLGVLKGYIEPIFILLPLNLIGELAKVISMSFRLFGNMLGGAIVMSIAVQALAKYKVHFMLTALIVLAFYLVIVSIVDLEKHPVVRIILSVFL